jgi:hypothetical protein
MVDPSMSVKIATCATFDAAAQKIVAAWREQGSPRLIRVDGFAGVGKSGLASLIRKQMGAEHIEADKFVNRFDEPPPYRECIRQAELDSAIERAVKSGHVVILDAVCLEEIAPEEKWGRGFAIYVKRLSFNNVDPMWHDGYRLEEEPPSKEVHRSIHVYHARVKPHQTAHLIVELPNEGHSIWPETYSRDLCFDPPCAEMI